MRMSNGNHVVSIARIETVGEEILEDGQDVDPELEQGDDTESEKE
mgnify:CR=1 FL=1